MRFGVLLWLAALYPKERLFLLNRGGLARVRKSAEMLGLPATTVVAGQGLGPAVCVAVPFAEARCRGTMARFAGACQPHRDGALVRRVVELAPRVFLAIMAGARDEISAASKQRYPRTEAKE